MVSSKATSWQTQDTAVISKSVYFSCVKFQIRLVSLSILYAINIAILQTIDAWLGARSIQTRKTRHFIIRRGREVYICKSGSEQGSS